MGDTFGIDTIVEFNAGESVEVWSNSAQKWIESVVSQVEEDGITVEFSDDRGKLSKLIPQHCAGEYLRRPASGASPRAAAKAPGSPGGKGSPGGRLGLPDAMKRGSTSYFGPQPTPAAGAAPAALPRGVTSNLNVPSPGLSRGVTSNLAGDGLVRGDTSNLGGALARGATSNLGGDLV